MINSRFIIDGVAQELTPAQMLRSLGAQGVSEAPGGEDVLDESLDPNPETCALCESQIPEYREAVLGAFPGIFPVLYPASYAVGEVCSAIIGSLCSGAELPLEELRLVLSLSSPAPSNAPVGTMSAFYRALEAACAYMDGLDVRLACCSVEPSSGLGFSASCAGTVSGAEDAALGDDPVAGVVPGADACEEDWIVYVPFETAEYRLGGSLLCEALGISQGPAPVLEDTDYFMDCYEVVREMIQDGVALAACPVGRGGLVRALEAMCPSARISLADVLRANPRAGMVQVLFSEVPGILLRVRDSDFDYIDAEFLLQDVLFYPLGHPSASGGLRFESGSALSALLGGLVR